MKKVSYEEYREEVEKLRILLFKRTSLKEFHGDIWFTQRSTHNEPINLLVNFCSLGAVTPLVASRYADYIKEAAEMAKNFKYNGYFLK
jgi:hypothetical protein